MKYKIYIFPIKITTQLKQLLIGSSFLLSILDKEVCYIKYCMICTSYYLIIIAKMCIIA